MNNLPIDENKETIEQAEYTSMDGINAEVIGELRKDKIGKPILVIEMFVLFIIVLIAIPIVTGMLNDETSVLYKMIYGKTNNVVSPTPAPKKSEFLDGSKEHPLNSSTSMKLGNVIMKNFSLSGNTIHCTMYSYTGEINLDEEAYYLEVYSNSSKKLFAVKLTGSYDFQEKEVSLSAKDSNFNDNYSYFGKIVVMEDKDYPSVMISSDESGIGTLTCTKEDRTLEYTFKNNYLIRIKDVDKINFRKYSSDVYIRLKREYDMKSALIPDNSSVEENAEGFQYNAYIDLEKNKLPDTWSDYDYYKLDTEAKVVHYAATGKGFDCK